eukprot:gene1370-1972_t
MSKSESYLKLRAERLLEITKHKTCGNAHYAKRAYRDALAEYSKGVALCQQPLGGEEFGGSHDVMELLVTLRANRAACSTELVLHADGHSQGQAAKGWEDSTAVLDLPQHAPVGLTLKVHLRRAALLLAGLRSAAPFATAAAVTSATKGLKVVMESPAASKEQHDRARQLHAELEAAVVGGPPPVSSISNLFLQMEHLRGVPELRVGQPDQPRHSVARNYMDKAVPVEMKDGTPKHDLMEGMPAGDVTPEQIALMFGQGCSYIGETVFWRKWRGRLLGKVKWEAQDRTGAAEIALLDELWDCRWSFAAPADALGFHADMIAACRLDPVGGYLDRKDCAELQLPPDEQAALQGAEGVVLFANTPLKFKRLTAHVAANATRHLQMFGAAFVVGSVVHKIYISNGLNAPRKLQRAFLIKLVALTAKLTAKRLALPPQPQAPPQSRCGLAGADLQPAYARSFLSYAAAFREAAPWEADASLAHHFLLAAPPLLVSPVVVQIVGSSGINIGLRIWWSFAEFRASRLETPFTYSAPPIELKFVDPNGSEALPADVELMRQLGVPVAGPTAIDPLGRSLPVVTAGDSPEVDERMLLVVEAALAMAIQFFARMVVQKPVPPRPHPAAYTFETVSAELTYQPFAMNIELSCRVSFPSGNIPTADRPWCSFPHACKANGASRPARVRTIGEAAEFHRAALKPLRPAEGARLWRGHTFGLANALWELETKECTAEAIELAEQLFRHTQDDQDNVREFLLDLYLEAGRWDEALALLHRYSATEDTEGSGGDRFAVGNADIWAWTTALVMLHLHGLKSKRAAAAIVAAIQANPYVYPLLVRDEALDEDAAAAPRRGGHVTLFPNMQAHGDRRKALSYVWINRKHWWRLGGEHMLRALRSSGEAAYREWRERYAVVDSLMMSKVSSGGERDHYYAPLDEAVLCQQPKAVAPPHLCAQCGKRESTEQKKLMKCARCRGVSYCSRECQLGDWNRHKASCRRKVESPA